MNLSPRLFSFRFATPVARAVIAVAVVCVVIIASNAALATMCVSISAESSRLEIEDITVSGAPVGDLTPWRSRYTTLDASDDGGVRLASSGGFTVIFEPVRYPSTDGGADAAR